MKLLYLAVLSGCLLTLSPLNAAEPVISEIMPANERTLADEDGQFRDWIEINNPGTAPLELGGYFLTDNALEPTKWTFPPVTLPAGGFLVVFASGKDRTNNPAVLHTSFQLNADGGYVALVKSDGSNVVSSINYPGIKEDVAFGTARSLITTSLLAPSIPRVLVPNNAGELPADWNQLAFSPGASWLTGPAPPAVGFDTNRASGAPANVARSGTAVQSTVNGSFTANLAINGLFTDFTHTLGPDTSPFWQVTLTNEMSIFSVILFNRTSCCGSRLRDITIDILSTNASGIVTNWTSSLLNPENTGFTYPNGPAFLSNNLVTLTGGPVAGRIVRVSRAPDLDLSGTGGQQNDDNEKTVLSLGEVVINASSAAGLRPYFTTDIETNLLNVNASAFARMPFTLTDTPDLLTLNVRYDDGFVAYLNGVKIAERNAPPAPAWDSTATADRNFASATALESIDVSAGIPALVPGANVLAVQILNASADNSDVLFQPELIATRVQVTSNVFFVDATPGGPNLTGWYYDEVRDTRFSVDRGFFEAPFSLSITSSTPGAAVYYSFNGDEPGPGKGFLYTGPLTITNTTVLRTRAFRENWKATDVDTATYIFLGDVIYQAANWEQTRIPPPNFPATWGANAVDYGMDPQVVTNYTLEQWKEALTQIPSMSIVTEMRHLFDPTTGIYANASGHGEEWERPMSLELIDPSKPVPGQFQENGGLRIRGGFSRNPQFFKHSFRIFFNRGYGAAKLNYPLFEDEGAQEFEKFDLRTSQNYSWPRNESPTFDTMVREVFCRKTLGDMGQPYRRSRYYHLYLNGQYWGLYETDERPSAAYGESYFGGSKTNYDVVKCGNRSVTPNFATEATDGNFTAWSNLWVMCQIMRTNASTSNYFRPLGRNPDGTRNTNLEVLIDVDNLIDYMMGIFYTGDGDATLSAFLGNVQPNNWFGMRDRSNPNVGFRFFNSDCEHTLGSPSSQMDRTGPFGGPTVVNEGMFMWSNPQWMHEELARNIEYRVLFGDHVQKHFFNGGALTLEANTNRFIAKSIQINKAVRAYSARWGDAIRTTLAFGESDWTNALAFCLNWFVPRGNLVLAQLRADNLFPSLGAPAFSQLGGTVPDGYNLELSHTNASGVIYFTMDGSDPRMVGGAVNPLAQSYSLPIPINAPLLVRARVLTGTNWSAIVEAILHPRQDLRRLLVTEIMYNPPPVGLIDGEEYEFLEFKNTGTNTLNLSGLRFATGITFAFTNGTTLGPGQFFVIVRNPTRFAEKYPGVLIRGVYNGRLDNAGENLRLIQPLGGTLLSVNYDDRAPWPVTPDGHGFSLVPVDPNANPAPDDARNWRGSSAVGGSPGADDPTSVVPPILINEALTASILLQRDAIELFNPTANSASIAGWFLTDEPDTPKKFRIPDGTSLAAGAFALFTETQFNPTPGLSNSFSLRAEGDDVYLFSADAAGNLTGYSHGFSFGAAEHGVTFGRYRLSTGEDDFTAQVANSLSDANAGPKIGPVVINEIHYHPDAGDDEFIELKNITGESVPLYDPNASTNTWRLNGLGYDFPANLTLGSNALLLIVPTDPEAFRLKYTVAPDVIILGPYAGQLQDSGERLELQKPGPPDTNSAVAYINVDAVRYNDRAPWPPAADGSGPSLQRKNSLAYGNDPINWEGAVPTPGQNFIGGPTPVITEQPVDVSIIATREATFRVTATGPGPLFYQWRFNGQLLLYATNSSLVLTNLRLSQSGNYTVQVFNQNGSVESDIAVLTVLVPAFIFVQPTNRAVWIKPDSRAVNTPGGTNVTFTVAATSTTPIRYQWLFNAVPILDATNTSYTVTNVQLVHEGDYICVLTDGAGTISSAAAHLTPLIQPIIIQPPLSQTVVEGSDFSASVEVMGNPAPFAYSWRRALPLGTIASNYGNFRSNFITLNTLAAGLVLTNNMASSNYELRLIVFNEANLTPGVLVRFTNTVVADFDRDGIPDAVENALGLITNNPADGADDLDGDGMSNRAEYVAGTDPANAASYLKITSIAAGGGATLTFGAISNKTYTIQYSEGLGGGAWTRLKDLAATRTNRNETVFDPAFTTNRFYRIATPYVR